MNIRYFWKEETTLPEEYRTFVLIHSPDLVLLWPCNMNLSIDSLSWIDNWELIRKNKKGRSIIFEINFFDIFFDKMKIYY